MLVFASWRAALEKRRLPEPATLLEGRRNPAKLRVELVSFSKTKKSNSLSFPSMPFISLIRRQSIDGRQASRPHQRALQVALASSCRAWQTSPPRLTLSSPRLTSPHCVGVCSPRSWTGFLDSAPSPARPTQIILPRIKARRY